MNPALAPLEEDAPRPDGSDRYAVYKLTLDGRHVRVAETSLEGIGLTVTTLAAEGHFTEGIDERSLPLGLFDREARVWIINPWATRVRPS